MKLNKYYLIDVVEGLKKIKNDSTDIIIIDPPYLKDMVKKILQTLEGYDILSPNGLIVVQHSKAEELPKDSLKFSLIKEAKYGDTWLSIFSHAGREKE